MNRVMEQIPAAASSKFKHQVDMYYTGAVRHAKGHVGKVVS